MRYKFYLLVSFIVLSGMTCKKDPATCHDLVTIENLTEKAIYVSFSFEPTHLFTEDFYGRTVQAKSMYKFGPVDTHTSNPGLFLRDCFETSMRLQGQGKLYLSVLDSEQVENTSPELLVAQKYTLKAYELSIDELDKIGWKIKFTEQ